MTIYLDAVWILNFLFDWLLLLLTRKLARDQTKNIRIIFGALVASAIVPFSIYFPDSMLLSLPGKLLFSVIIILVTFGFISIHRLSKLLLLFYFITFAIGGGLIAVNFLLQNTFILSGDSGSAFGDPVSWIFVFVGFPLLWLFTKRRMDKHAMEKIDFDQQCSVIIQLKDKSQTTIGYIDSGNQLTDPITKKPVIICDEFFLKHWFTNQEWNQLKEAQDTLNFDLLPEVWRKEIQLVPYRGVGGRTMMLICLKPENVTVFYEDQKMTATKVLIGVQFAELAKDRSYHCLLHPELIRLAGKHSA